MKRLFPYPLLFLSLLIFWLLLNGFTRGQIIIGLVLAFAGMHIMTALEPRKNHIGHVGVMIRLFLTIALDILMSNLAVSKLILFPSAKPRKSGFVTITLTLENRMALAILACIVTATPGTAWVDYNLARRVLTIHVLDLESSDYWRDLITQRYEKPLLVIFDQDNEPMHLDPCIMQASDQKSQFTKESSA